MMLNLIAIAIYLLLSFYITIAIGRKCYKIGAVYLKNYMQDSAICKSINHSLLVGYYLVNLGYIAVSVNSWHIVASISQSCFEISAKLSTILLLLCALHYINIFTIYILRKKQNSNL